MDIDQDIKINAIAGEGTLTQNSSISGLTGASTTKTNEDLFKRMAQSKCIMEMLWSGILTEEQVKQIAVKMTDPNTGAAVTDEPGKKP